MIIYSYPLDLKTEEIIDNLSLSINLDDEKIIRGYTLKC